MKSKFISVLIILGILFIAVTPVYADNRQDDKVVFGGTYSLRDGETLFGNLIVIGGAASLEKGSTVNGNVTVIGGTVKIFGDINGSISLVGGSLTLGDTAVVTGDVFSNGGSINRSEKARITGQYSENFLSPFQTGLFNSMTKVPAQPTIFTFFRDAMFLVFRAIGTAVLAMLVAMFAAKPIKRISNAIIHKPVATGLIGLLTAVVAPLILVIITITIILIPVSLVAIIALIAAVFLGWISLGTEIGVRISGMFKKEWHIAVSAGLGTLILTLVADGIGSIPCVGWIVPVLISFFAVGSVIATRAGTRSYPTGLVETDSLDAVNQ